MRATFLSLLAASTIPCQSWTQVTTSSDPGQIRDAAMAFHSASGNVVLFGGWPALGATWEYDGSNWSNANAVGALATTLESYSEGVEQHDDITAIALRHRA